MKNINAWATLPYLLRVSDGKYGDIEVKKGPATHVFLPFKVQANQDLDERQKISLRKANQLLTSTNNLLRWYRYLTKDPSIVELTKGQLSPFRFLDDRQKPYHDDLNFESESLFPGHPSIPTTKLTQELRKNLKANKEPPLADLIYLDAQVAKTEGRFRETVLFSWSAIDTIFNATYDSLLAQALEPEGYAKSKDHLQGKSGEMPLRIKMTGMMRLLTQRSLSSDQKKWSLLGRSYDKRNDIIHRAGSASEHDAQTALDTAKWVLDFMRDLP